MRNESLEKAYLSYSPSDIKSLYSLGNEIVKVSKLFTYKYHWDTLKSHEDAQDISIIASQKTLDAIIEGKFRGDSKLSTFLYKVIRNTKSNYLGIQKVTPKSSRKGFRRNLTSLEDLYYLADEDTEPYSELLFDLCEDKVKTMNADDQSLFYDIVVDGKPSKKSAEKLGISDVNTRVKVTRLKKTLREYLPKDIRAHVLNP